MNSNCKIVSKAVFLFLAILVTLSMTRIMQANTTIEIEANKRDKIGDVEIFNIASTVNGDSYNTIDDFNVTESGVILNNSKEGTDTQLSGHIDGNSNLIGDVADVIILEVNSKKSSEINGPVEIAGSDASVILSNPLGITCNSCEFLSANRIVLTTGSLQIKNNKIDSYKVEKGSLTINGHTTFNSIVKNIDLIARNILINGVIDANNSEVRMTTGANQVNTENDQAINIPGSGPVSKYSLKIVKDVEFNAGTFKFIGTEKTAPLQNYGKLGGEDGGINITHSGVLQNEKGMLLTKGDINISVDGGISNKTGKIKSSKTITIDTRGEKFSNVDGSDVSSLGTISINSGALTNNASYIASDDTLNIQTNGNEVINSSTIGKNLGLSSNNGIKINSGIFNNKKAQITSNGDIEFNTNIKNFNNIESKVDTLGNIIINSGALNNDQSRLRAVKKIAINTNSNTLKNRGITGDTDSDDSLGILSGDDGMSITISGLTNNKAIMATKGNMLFSNKGTISNQWGQIQTGGFLNFTSDSINNLYGGLASDGGAEVTIEKTLDNNFGVIFLNGDKVTINTPYVNNHKGVVTGDIISIKTKKLNNIAGLIITKVSLDVDTPELINNESPSYRPEMGFYIGQSDQVGGMISKGDMTLTGDKLYSINGRIIAENGSLKIKYKNIDNTKGLIVSKKENVIESDSFINNYGMLYGKESLKLATIVLNNLGIGTVENNNLEGVIASDGTTDVTISSDFINNGMISGIKQLLVNIDGKYTNSINSYMSGEKKFSLSVTGNIINSGVLNSKQVSTISGKDITNEISGIIVGRSGIKIYNSGSFTNKGKLIGEIIE